jgi:hypothetical protein
MDKHTYERDEQVEIFLDGAWVPALIKGVNTQFAGVGKTVSSYIVQPDLSGQPQFTNRPARNYHAVGAVTEDSLRARGSSDDSDSKVDVYAPAPTVTNSAPGDFSHPDNLKNLGLLPKKEDLEANRKAQTVVPAGTSTNIRSDNAGNVNHGANASVQLVGDVTGSNGTGSVNADGAVPAATPDTPVNQTPYTVEASTDPALTDTKTGNALPVNPTTDSNKLVASDKADGAVTSQVPVPSKDDHTANAEASDDESDDNGTHADDNTESTSAIDNPNTDAVAASAVEGDATVDEDVEPVKVEDTVLAPKNSSDKVEQSDQAKAVQNSNLPLDLANDVADVQSATGDNNPQLPATDTQATDGTVNTVRSQPGGVTADEDAANDDPGTGAPAGSTPESTDPAVAAAQK